MVGERVFFKHNHYLYLVRDFKDGTIELWAVAARKPYEWEQHEYSLGSYVLKEWIKPKGFYNYTYAMQRGAQKLLQGLLKEIASENKREYTKAMTKEKKPVYDTQYFKDQGKKGHEAMLKKYGKAAVNFRWEKRDKESK